MLKLAGAGLAPAVVFWSCPGDQASSFAIQVEWRTKATRGT